MTVHPLLRFFDHGYVVRLFMLLFIPASAMIADGLLLILLAERYGRYLALAITGATGLLGLFFLGNSVSTTLMTLRRHVSEGRYPRRQYHSLAALVVAGLLLLTPGLFTDVLGLLFYVPPLRLWLGALVCLPIRNELKELYQYLKMDET
jgi:UPF0716 family protein affecting phage T7 exclusion